MSTEHDAQIMGAAKHLEQLIRAGEPYVADLLNALEDARHDGKRALASGLPRDGVYAEITAERAEQDLQWGGSVHDDEHSIGDWTLFITKQLGKLSNQATWAQYEPWAKAATQAARVSLIKIAALAVAAIGSIDRKGKL